MRRVIFFLLILTSCNLDSAGKEMSSSLSYAVTVANLAENKNLEQIQSKIYQAFVNSLMNKTNESMETIRQDLEQIHKKNPQNLIQYWRAYEAYYQSIFHSVQKDKAASEAHADRGISYLKNMKNKNTEDYALLALLQSFSIQFKSGIGAGMLSSKVKKNANKAKELDPSNPRAYFVLGSNDYYTPEMYGGGKKAEEYLLKAISLPAQATPNKYLPSWGIEESYEMLIKYYMKHEKWDSAKKHFASAKEKFPSSYNINALASNLVGK